MIDKEKAALRREMAARRAAAAEADPTAGETLAAFAEAIAGRAPNGLIVAGYVRFRSEIDPLPLLRAFDGAGAVVALPVTPARAADGLVFRRWRPSEPLALGRFGVPEPDVSAPAVDPDLVLVPLLAFDRAGRRLGYGKGFYDYTLAGLRRRKAIRVVGLAFAAQEVARVPTDDHDAPLDGVLTETGLIEPIAG
jgi:5-formyltetrahydrofolate cyclo-ligase